MATGNNNFDSSFIDIETYDSGNGASYEGKKSYARTGRKPEHDDVSDDDDEIRQDDDDEAGFRNRLSKGVANYVWEESRQRAKKAFSLYANIDILRPYYDVEPREVVNRLIASLVPKMPSATGPKQSVPREMYGPTMLVLTMIAMLLFEMKTSGHIVQEGTLMGTAFGTCFGYWIGVSSLLWLTTYVCNTRITLLQILHLLGYALFGHCLVLFLTTVFHPTHTHLFFYSVWLLLGGLSTLRMISVFVARTSGKSQRLILSGVIATFHLLFLLYLHFSYHRVVEELSAPLSGRPAPLSPQESFPQPLAHGVSPIPQDTVVGGDQFKDTAKVNLPSLSKLQAGEGLKPVAPSDSRGNQEEMELNNEEGANKNRGGARSERGAATNNEGGGFRQGKPNEEEAKPEKPGDIAVEGGAKLAEGGIKDVVVTVAAAHNRTNLLRRIVKDQ